MEYVSMWTEFNGRLPFVSVPSTVSISLTIQLYETTEERLVPFGPVKCKYFWEIRMRTFIDFFRQDEGQLYQTDSIIFSDTN